MLATLPVRRTLARLPLALVLAACQPDAEVRDAAGLDVPGLDVPGLDVPGLDVPGLDAPGSDAGAPPGLSCIGPVLPPPPAPACPSAAPTGCTPGSPAPLGYWRFEATDRTRDETGRWPLRVPSGADGEASFGADGAVGGHLAMRTASPNNNARVYVPYAAAYPAALTLELLVRFRPGTLAFEDIRVVRMLGGAELALSRDGWSFGRVEFPLDGDDVAGWPYYTDGRWHHLALVADGTRVSLAVDGRHPARWTVPGTLPTGSGPGIYFGYFAAAASQGLDMDLDEVALFAAALPSSVLAQHAADALAGRPYGADACAVDWCTPRAEDPSLDPLDYVPGWSATDWRAASVDPLTQLTSFPLPRFRAGHTLPRIPSIWVDPDYLAGQFEQVPGTYAARFSLDAVAANATALQLELAERWHQGLARHSRTTAEWTAYANAHPEVQLGTASFWRGRVFGLSAAEQVDGAASPALDPAIFAPDGAASRDALVNWARTTGLSRSFDLIVENGETPVDAMHGLTEADLASNPAASAHWTANRAAFGGDFRAYVSTRERDFIRGYRDAFLAPRAADRPAALRDAMFTYYELDGYGTYSPTWSIIRDALGAFDDGRPRAATSFYPRRAAWWYSGAGAWHGWDWIRRSRPDEIAAGDRHFWPLVAAGWAFHEERNLRPAQWLAILKSLSVAGADAMMPAYFVIPGCGGDFGGATDCDCTTETTCSSTMPCPTGQSCSAGRCVVTACLRDVVQNRASYAWQAVTPSYAQGIASRYDDLLYDPESAWRTDVTSPDPGSLAVVRQAGRRFVIAVSTHTLSNERTGRSYAERPVSVRLELDGDASTLETLRLFARPQGAVYLLDAGASPPSLRWLDAWHEATHPAYWSEDFSFEAEVDDGRLARGDVSLVTRTERAPGAPAWDFVGATSYLAAPSASFAELPEGAAPQASYAFAPRADTAYGVWVRARTRGRPGTVRVALDDGPAIELGCVRDGAWAWVRLACPGADVAALGTVPAGPHTLRVEPSSTDIEIDAIRLTTDEACFADAVDCGGCG